MLMESAKKIMLILTFISCLISGGCENIEPLTIPNREFSLDLWSDWELELQQGIDTYTGFYANGHEKIYFDYGIFAGGNFNAVMGGPGVLYYEETIIDSFPAKIVKTVYNENTELELLIDRGDEYSRVVVSVVNSNKDEKYIAIFKTFRFL